jgi:beta-barrel assembly-enhancing protease
MKAVLLGVSLSLAATSCAISTQQEVEMGTQYSQQINSQLPIVRDAEVNRYINLLGESITSVADTRHLDWHFYVVDSREVNAFAVPGGFVYVNRGLIERTTSMNQLAGVLGHEIGHVVRRHSVKQMEKAQTGNAGLTLLCVLTRYCESQVVGAAVQVGGSALFAKFSRDDEREADAVAIPYLVRAGIDPRGIPQMFQILIDERSRRRSSVDAWFATHPLEEDRITETQRLIAGLPASSLRNLTQDTRAFQSFRQRLSSIPVAARRGQ